MPHRVNTESFGFLITDISRLIRAEMDRAIAEAGIGVTAGEARTLSHAARAGSVRQNVLAERMGVEAMTLSSYLDRLEARGLVVRVGDPRDRRAKLVELTEDAGAVLDAVALVAAQVRRKAAGAFSSDEWDALLALLKTVRGNLAGQRPQEAVA
ncbi:MarR family winged helix-turn-helix transcriptional regulator [Nitratireductor soli]|uniref:MarR family winged helix-turn-helix transcriptional regulator n=1 Tax=Nitratireductor soli TaxID=1670619 RepID=UPI00065E480D|nr:MarR family winged helix-turn-helix transcriptional regulator [Nitratireductor soli]